MGLAAVFDAGKTRLKLSLVTHSGEIVSTRSAQAVARPPSEGYPWPALDIDTAEAFLVEALSAAGEMADLQFLVPIGHGAAAVWIDDAGAAAPPIDYEAEIPAAIDDAYQGVRPSFRESGSPSLPRGLNLGRQLYWTAKERPELGRKAALVPWPQYWAWRLSGAAASEVSSLGCHSDLWSVRDRSWSSLARDKGWDRRFAPLRPAEAILGPASGPVSRAAGLHPSIRVLCGAHDSNAALHAVRRSIAGADGALVSTGTWVVALAPGTRPDLESSRDCLINVAVDGTPVATARFMGGREHAELAPEPAEATVEDCARLVGTGTMVVPPLVPLGGPFLGRQGRIDGEMPASADGKAALAAAYLALMTDYCLDLIGCEGPVVVEGPLAGNAAALGLLAALRRAPVMRCSADLVAVGGAVLAFGSSAAKDLQLERVRPWRVGGWTNYAAAWRTRAKQNESIRQETGAVE